jgi:hypothetical protein
MEIGSQRQARKPYPHKRDPVPFLRKAGSGRGAENNTPTGISFLDRPVRIESLYRLSYPGSPIHLLQESFLTHRLSSITRRTLPNDIKIRPHITELTAKHL